MKLCAVIERITYQNGENGYSILKARVKGSVHDDNVFAEEMKEKLNKQFPDYKFSIVIDHNYTEES